MRKLLMAIPLGAALLTAGCMGGPAEGTRPLPLTPTQRYVLQVEPGLDRIALAVHESGLSDAQRRALADLAQRFRADGAAVVRIEAPAGGDPVTTTAAYDIKSVLDALGAPADRVQITAYNAPDPRAPVLVGFETVRAVTPRCGAQWGSLTRSGNNAGMSNFGCAVTANLAAQIADPRDIAAPRASSPVDAGRRAVVIAAYRGGEQTSAQREELITSQRVSRAVE